ncbi:hypothetical protein Vafri_4719 [Volvox africanus]|uniref:AB hydrolase-1 domain-containing protein n=1 Tax=Volvox africanus TaxID=51714 RepID=A0A8J4AUJ4_9CHLO|nr:hypothetical protein Vafri_4719 [Volvox africanus]
MYVVRRRSPCPKHLVPFPRCLPPSSLRSLSAPLFISLHVREFCALLGLRRVAVIGFSSGTPFATAIACVQPPSSTTSAAATATVNAHTNTNTFKSTNNNSITTTHIGSLNSSAPTSSAKPSSITATTPCCCADDALSAALLATPAPTAATSAAADSTAAGAAAPRAVLGPAATEAVTATTVTSTVTATAAAVPTLQPLHNQALSTAQGQTEPGQGLVEGVALVSAIGPPNTPNKGRGMALVFRFGFWACAHAPSIVGWMVRVKASALRRRPLNVLRKSFAPYNAKADVAVLKRPEVERMFLESTLELYGRFQEDAVIREKLLFAARPWGFNIAACGLPVAIWQGAQDRGCTAAMATYLSEQMGPKARVHVVPEQGHLLYFDVWHEVVDWLNGLART